MRIEIDFESDEAIYRQLYRKIIMEIAAERLREGDSLPSVRDLADMVGINMHTVNKAYTILKEEGFLAVDRRRGAVVYIEDESDRAREELKENLRIALAKARCRHLTKADIHELIDEICGEYES